MAEGNAVTFTGNAVAEPTLRYTGGGTAVASFGLAVNNRRKNPQTQEWEDEPAFVDITAWGELAENISESLPKGARVTVTGRIKQDNWADKETGEKRSKLGVVADDVAVSLRWATTVITRTPRSEGGDHSEVDHQG